MKIFKSLIAENAINRKYLKFSTKKIYQPWLLLGLWLFIMAIVSILPHPADFTPTNNLCLLLVTFLPLRWGLPAIFCSVLLADIVLSFYCNYPIWGNWTFFTYTGFLAIGLFGVWGKAEKSTLRYGVSLLSGSLFFWLWTNAGVWLTTSYYSNTLLGFIQCYYKALPFLRNALLGDLTWMILLIIILPFFLQALSKKWSLVFRQMSIKKNSM